jgi:hypothetical protein
MGRLPENRIGHRFRSHQRHGEIANLALTVGMEFVLETFVVE